MDTSFPRSNAFGAGLVSEFVMDICRAQRPPLFSERAACWLLESGKGLT